MRRLLAAAAAVCVLGLVTFVLTVAPGPVALATATVVTCTAFGSVTYAMGAARATPLAVRHDDRPWPVATATVVPGRPVATLPRGEDR